MAAIDHETIMFKNGCFVKDEFEYVFTEHYNGKCRRIVDIPFQYSRDGEIYGFDFDKTRMKNRWYNGVSLVNIVEVFESEDVFVWVLHTPYYNVSLYMDDDDTYVLLGGYGHYGNPFTHFINRGYGEDFELKMLYECYTWLCERELPDNIRGASRCDFEDVDSKNYESKLYYCSYFNLPEQERFTDRQIKYYVSKPEEIGEWE